MNQKQKPRKKRSYLYALLIFLIILVVASIGVFINNQKLNAPSDNNFQNQRQPGQPAKNKSTNIRDFTPDEFRDLYNSFVYPNTELINEETPIVGDAKADARIRQLAEARGYQLRSAPVSNAFIEVSEDRQLQQRAAQAWVKLASSAKKDNIGLNITEGLRSAEDQKAIFLERLGDISISSIADGLADERLNEVLKKTAPPGYSRHHSGYTIDLECDNQTGIMFENTVCFEWLSKDNYINAKKAGWIPSYPEGTKLQGPEPESWEYVWVGVDSLSE